MKGLFAARGALTGKGSMLSCFGLGMAARSSLIPKRSFDAMMIGRGGGNAGRMVQWALGDGNSRKRSSSGGGQRTPLNLSR